MDTIKLTTDTLNKILNYLSVQPYNEVAELINITVTEVKQFKEKEKDKPIENG